MILLIWSLPLYFFLGQSSNLACFFFNKGGSSTLVVKGDCNHSLNKIVPTALGPVASVFSLQVSMRQHFCSFELKRPWVKKMSETGSRWAVEKRQWTAFYTIFREYSNYTCMYIYGCFLKWWYPQIIHFNRVFHYQPSIWGYPYFRKHPYIYIYMYVYIIYICILNQWCGPWWCWTWWCWTTLVLIMFCYVKCLLYLTNYCI